MRQRKLRLSATLALIAIWTLAAVLDAGAATPRLPIDALRLVAAPSSFPIVSPREVLLTFARSPAGWAYGILKDPPANGRREVARLKREGFLEATREIVVGRNGNAFSGAILMRKASDARRETRIKVSEEQQELGAGTTRFTVAAVPGGIGLNQHGPSRELAAGAVQTSVVFAVSRCVIGVGVILASPAPESDARNAAIAAASHLAGAVRRICS